MSTENSLYISANPNTVGVRNSGVDAMIRKIQIALSLRKGSFIYDTDMGIDWHEGLPDDETKIKTLEALINEAVYPIYDSRIRIMGYNREESRLDIMIELDGNYYRTEVSMVG